MQVIRKALLAWPLPAQVKRKDGTSTAITVRDTVSSLHDFESDDDFATVLDEAREKLSNRNASSPVRCPSAAKGTPCTTSWSTLNPALVRPQFLETPEWTRRMTLMMALCAWNLSFDRVLTCCSLHAWIDEAVRLLSGLRQTRCTSVTTYDGWQCPECKVLDVEGDGNGTAVRVCGICGHGSTSQSSSAGGAPDAQLHEPPQPTERDSARANFEALVHL